MWLILRFPSTVRLSALACILALTSCNNSESYWSGSELQTIGSLSLASLNEVPAEPSNRFSQNEKAAQFGRQLFFDKRFSANGELSCASCHQPENGFTDGLRLSKGIHQTGRNTQSLIGSAHQKWFYWDGRKDSLWSQALVPFESANEMAGSRVGVLRVVGKDPDFKMQYEALFGDFPSSVYGSGIAKDAGPWGNTETRDNWYRIPANVQMQINSAYANIGKSIAAYERSLSIPKTRFDAYSEVLLEHGEKRAKHLLSEDEISGLKLYIDTEKTHCMRCHNGPLFSNSDFHNIGTGTFDGPNIDFGRFFGIQAAMQDEFNCLGAYSDANPDDCDALRFLPKQIHQGMQGAFKTPTLRYLNKTAPFLHDGRFSTIEQVLTHYTNTPTPDSELPEMELTDRERMQLNAFIETLGMPDEVVGTSNHAKQSSKTSL